MRSSCGIVEHLSCIVSDFVLLCMCVYRGIILPNVSGKVKP